MIPDTSPRLSFHHYPVGLLVSVMVLPDTVVSVAAPPVRPPSHIQIHCSEAVLGKQFGKAAESHWIKRFNYHKFRRIRRRSA